MREAFLNKLLVPAVVVVAATAGVMWNAGAQRLPPLTPLTPPGITLVEVMRELPLSQPEVLWLRLGDEYGHTLFTADADPVGAAQCTGECAQQFPPVLAAAAAEPSGDWSLIKRSDGAMQWAYQGRALYRWSEERIPGEVAINVGLTETANSKLAENPVQAGSLMPPEGWQVARFTPAASLQLPDGIDARLVDAVQTLALTDAEGFTLYAYDGEARTVDLDCITSACETRWVPVLAPELAADHGEFTVVERQDGIRQWAHRGRALFANSIDRLPGDALAEGLDARWSVARLRAPAQPADVQVMHLEGYGDALTVAGRTLYAGYSFEKRWGGRNLRDTFTNVHHKGRQLGADACAQADCLTRWQPFQAPADAQPQGFWEVLERPDGQRQWAYKGYALYTFAGDSAPGHHYGQATYEFADVGQQMNFQRVAHLQQISRAAGGIGVYWNIAKP